MRYFLIRTRKFLLFTEILSIFIFFGNSESPDPSPAVSLKNGDILEGFHVSTPSGARGRVFLGVPYAEPPVGPFRFEKPHPPAHDPKNLTCLVYKSNCWQNHTHIEKPITDLDEDCLYLNIFAGYACRNGSECPVLYYIHGGAFEFDAPSMFPVDLMVENFATHGLIFVTVAYRLGILGFWSLGSEEAVGNYALYDVMEGLRWVKQEISAFGGDPTQITIMGHSSGASSVSLLTLSPKSRGLFQSAIIMSGGTPSLNADLSRYHRLAADVGCARNRDWSSNHKYDRQIVECMRRVPAEILVNIYRGYEDLASPVLHTSPLYDGPNGVFPELLPDLMKKRPKIDTVIGTTKNEVGQAKFSDINATADSLAELCKSTIEKMSLSRNKRLLTHQCKNQYVKKAIEEEKSRNQSQNVGKKEKFSVWTEKTADLKNDFAYFAPAFKEASSLAKAGGNVFLYSFDYEKTGLEGVAPWHGFDLTYVMGIHPFDFDDRDYAIKSIYVPLFVNFAKFGTPTPNSQNREQKWTPLQTPPMEMNYLSVDLPRAIMKNGYHYDGVLFWDYVVPAIGGEKSKSEKRFLSYRLNGVAENEKKVDGVNWHAAFWITLLVSVVILLSLGITALVVYARRHYWRCPSCTCTRICRCPRKAKNEEEALLSYMKHADSYATFY